MTTTTTRPKSNSSNLLEEALNQPPIGETANFAWNATPLGIAAIPNGVAFQAKLAVSPMGG